MSSGKWTSGQSSNGCKNCRGFTLLEVIIALGIVAIGILAVSRSITGFAETTITLEQRMVANWIAGNRLETLKILRSSPVPGTSHGSEAMAERTWYFRETTTATADPFLFRVEITVFIDQEETEEAGSLHGYLLDQQAINTPLITGRHRGNSTVKRYVITASLRDACDGASAASSMNVRGCRASLAITEADKGAGWT